MEPPPDIPASSSRGLQWFGRTDRGKVRANNEDAFVGLQFDAREVHHLGAIGDAPTQHLDFAFAVSDGMGGANAGEHASRAAVDTITKLLPQSYQQSASGLDAGASDVLEELFARVHRELVQLGRSYEDCSGMEATLSLCWFTPAKMYFGHVGDSRIYYLPAGDDAIRQLTHDDTHVGWLFRSGKINEREARSHPRRNVLQKALGGSNQFVSPQVGAVTYASGDIFLLCSDGLVDGLYNHHVTDVLRAHDFGKKDLNLALQIVNESVARSGKDNTTALIVHVL